VPPPVILAAFGKQGQSATPADAITVAELPSRTAIIPQEKPAPVLASAAVPYADGDTIASLIDSLAPAGNARTGRTSNATRAPAQIAALRPSLEPGATDGGNALQNSAGLNTAVDRNWSVQIGAFANEAAANLQLQVYAERSADVLGEAERLVVPYAGEGGSIYYRARFGPFEESEAREVCQRMMTRGETCFASRQGTGG